MVYGLPLLTVEGLLCLCPFSSVFTVYLSTLLYSQHLLINMSKSPGTILSSPSGWKQLFKKKVLSSEILSSLTCQDLYTVYNKLSSVLKRLILGATNLLTWKMIVTVRIHVL